MLTVKNLNFTYPGAVSPAANGLDFSVAEGEVFGFLGPNGAGKSTTQKILIGLLQGYSGSVSIMGRDLQSWGTDYYERIGVSFERPNHFMKLSAIENLNYFRSLYGVETEDPMVLLKQFGLGDDANRRVIEFSKGMQVRLNIVRSLIHRPRLLFLDEPTAGLDPVNIGIVKEQIQNLCNRGTTIFLTTHNMALADDVCERVAFIVNGRIELINSPRDLKIKYGQRIVRVECGSGQKTTSTEFPLQGLEENPEFLKRIGREDLQTIHTQETTLEDIFIRVTGRRLE